MKVSACLCKHVVKIDYSGLSTHMQSTLKGFIHLFEIRQQGGSIPALGTNNVCPGVVVRCSAAVVDHPIDRTSTPDQFSLGDGNTTVAKFGLRGCFDVPCIFEALRNST